jgi:hypothetical protein
MADGDREVLSSLPRTRPERRSVKRGARAGAGATDTPAKATAKAKAKAKPRPKASAKPRVARSKPSAARSKPRAVPPRQVPPSGYAVPKNASPVGAGGTELVGTAIQALGELANLGVSLGNRALREALGRLPKP